MDFKEEYDKSDEEYFSGSDSSTEYDDDESLTGGSKKPSIKIGDLLTDDLSDEELENSQDIEEEKIEENDEVELVNDDDDDDDDDGDEINDELEEKEINSKNLTQIINSDNEDDAEDSDEDDYLQKFDKEINDNYILNIHPECKIHNYDEISCLTKITYNSSGIIIDPLHRTIPILTKYERTRVLGQRTKQINSGSRPFVKVPENILDGYLIAEIELSQKRIPFIIRRPFPGGGCEYWNLKDLELIDY
jgi:DNA-directed RNA polymerase subunit K/omega